MPQPEKNSRILAFWLFSCAFMVMVMTAIGAITRLTESGLSITEWKVISGALPPLSDAAWQGEFAKYQATPEFAAKHAWMTLGDFKGIYFWEWSHRLWGRLIGVVFALPMLFFFIKGWIPKKDRLKYLGLLLLGGAQGALGWFMVKSGLVDRPSVSHFRLAAHLSTALIIYSTLIWMGLRQTPWTKVSVSQSIRIHGCIALLCVAMTIVWGAFVAGLDAGMIYNSFPLMGDGFAPAELGHTPFLSDPASVQFTHRLLAMTTGLVVFSYGLRWVTRNKAMGMALCGWVLVQIGLGIGTLLSVVNIHVAATHQIGAVILLTLMVVSLYLSSAPKSAD
jgi:cytochrome c oxidase assembly protein subunit 15